LFGAAYLIGDARPGARIAEIEEDRAASVEIVLQLLDGDRTDRLLIGQDGPVKEGKERQLVALDVHRQGRARLHRGAQVQDAGQPAEAGRRRGVGLRNVAQHVSDAGQQRRLQRPRVVERRLGGRTGRGQSYAQGDGYRSRHPAGRRQALAAGQMPAKGEGHQQVGEQ
jgi:hypothetical protein